MDNFLVSGSQIQVIEMFFTARAAAFNNTAILVCNWHKSGHEKARLIRPGFLRVLR